MTHRHRFNLDSNPAARRTNAGFTLIEMLISTAVLAILATVALPAYSDYVRRGQLYEAFGALADYRARMEQYFQDNNSYGSEGCADGASPISWNRFAPEDARHFRYACKTDPVRQRYTITATGVAGNAVGHVFTIDQNGGRATLMFKGGPVDESCWLTTSTRC